MNPSEPEKVTLPYLTKYEKARILGERAQQLSLGSSPNISLPSEEGNDPLEIARLELTFKKMPMMIKRYLPDGSFEIWDVNKLKSHY